MKPPHEPTPKESSTTGGRKDFINLPLCPAAGGRGLRASRGLRQRERGDTGVAVFVGIVPDVTSRALIMLHGGLHRGKNACSRRVGHPRRSVTGGGRGQSSNRGRAHRERAARGCWGMDARRVRPIRATHPVSEGQSPASFCGGYRRLLRCSGVPRGRRVNRGRCSPLRCICSRRAGSGQPNKRLARSRRRVIGAHRSARTSTS